MKKKQKKRRFPDFDLIPSGHLIDSMWLSKDKKTFKVIMATGQVFEHRELKENEKSL